MYTSPFYTDHEYSSNLQWKDCQNLLPLWIEKSLCPPMSWSMPMTDPTGQEMVQLWRKGTLCYCVPQSTFTSSSSTVNKDNTQSREVLRQSKQPRHGQVVHFANRCPDLRQLSTPTQGNQNMARTPVYKKWYNCGQKCHFANVCPYQRYCPDVTTVATSTPNH
jgi:hypothetical protein